MNSLINNLLADKKKTYAALFLVPLLVYIYTVTYEFSPRDEVGLIVNRKEWLDRFQVFIDMFLGNLHGIYYRPLLMGTFAVDVMIYGIDPFGFHLTNVLMHAFSVVLLFRLLEIFVQNKPVSFICSLVFAVHPINIDAVAWVPGRNDILVFIFLALSIIQLHYYIQTDERKHLNHHLFWFACSLFTKESSAFYPLVYIFIWILMAGYSKRLWLPTAVWAAFCVAWLIIRSNYVDMLPRNIVLIPELIRRTVISLFGYTGKVLFPYDQSVASIPDGIHVLPGIIAGLLLGACFYFKILKSRRIALIGIGAYFLLLIVPSWYGSRIPQGFQDEHRMYAPMAALMIFFSQLNIERLKKQWIEISGTVIVVCILITHLRLPVYSTTERYIIESLEDCPNNYLFRFNYADMLYKQGRNKEAITYYTSALALGHSKPQIYNNRANAYVNLGIKDSAIADYSRALELNKNNADLLVARCLTYRKFGDMPNCMNEVLLIKHLYPTLIPPETERAIVNEYNKYMFDQVNALIKAEPEKGIYYVNRAKMFVDLRKGKEALADLKKACELEPRNEDFKRYYQELESSIDKK